jgi:hypothetical protein
MKHFLRQHFWDGGVLRTVEHEFKSLEHALEHVERELLQVFKIFDELGHLICMNMPDCDYPHHEYPHHHHHGGEIECDDDDRPLI